MIGFTAFATTRNEKLFEALWVWLLGGAIAVSWFWYLAGSRDIMKSKESAPN